jgi:putative peptidoglycan lipid II flippase
MSSLSTRSLDEPIGRTTRRRSSRLARASIGTAAGTLLSRLTGLLRLVVVAYALGGRSLADAYNMANNTPNMVHDLVLGGVLAATFVPVFVERLASAPRAEAAESISAVVTLAGAVLVCSTILFYVAAPGIIDLYTFGKANAAEHAVAVELLRLFTPQLLCYGAVSLMAAVLATRDRFVSVGFVPVLNNLVNIAILLAFAVLAHQANLAEVTRHHGLLLLLGIGTTAGVALQALALLPSLARAGVRLRLVWRPSDPAVRTILSLSGWTFGFVVANQLAVFVVLALEYHLGPGNVSAYTYAFQFFTFPFSVVAVSVINVATPDLTRAWAAGRLEVMGRRLGRAAQRMLALVLPATVGYLLLARPIVSLVLRHHAETSSEAHTTAAVLVMFSLGLPGFCLFFAAIRAFQAMQDTRTAFVLYILENGTNILAAILLYHPLGVRGLALSYSIAYTIGAFAALAVLRERLGTIGGSSLTTAALRSVGLSLLMAFVVALVATLIGTGSGLGGFMRLVLIVLAGAAVYLGGAAAAASARSWQTLRRRVGRHAKGKGVTHRHRH